jgi:peptide/nickel transport system permease protein
MKHALRNALIPLVTVSGLDIPHLFTGAVVTETIFAWPGMGRLFYDSLEARDYPVEMGLLMITATLIILGNLVADLLYVALDPRVRLGARPVA